MPNTTLSVLGAGVHAQSHLNELTKLGIKKIYYFDPNVELEIEGLEIVRCHTTDQLFNESGDAPVYIASPDRFHLTQMHRAILENRKIFCEKPLLNNAEEIESLKEQIALATHKNLPITSCHPRRFDKAYAGLLEPMIMGQSELTTDLGRVKKLSIHFDYKAPKPELPITSMMMDKLNHDLDILRMMFDIKDIALMKKYDSPRAFRVEGSLRTTDGDTIDLSFGGGRYAASGYQEWIQVEFDRGYVLINPDKQVDDAANSRGVSAINDAEVVIVDTTKETLQYHKLENMGTDYQARVTGVSRAVLNQFDDKPAYLSAQDLLFNNLLPAQLEQDWQGDDEQQATIDRKMIEIHKQRRLSPYLQDIILAARENDVEGVRTTLSSYREALARNDKDTVDLLRRLELHNEMTTTYNEAAIEAEFSERASKLGRAEALTQQYMRSYGRSAGVLPYYVGSDGKKYFGMVETKIDGRGIYDLAAGGEDVRISHIASGQSFTLDLRKPKGIPNAFRLVDIQVPADHGRAILTSFAEFDLAAKKYSNFYDDPQHPKLSLQRRQDLFRQMFLRMPEHGWRLDGIETDLVAGANEGREEHGYCIEQQDGPCQSYEVNLPSLRGDHVDNITHIWFAVETNEEKAIATELAQTGREEGCWVSLDELNAHYEQWLEQSQSMKSDTFGERINLLVLLANLQKYVGLVLKVAGEDALRAHWLERLPGIKTRLAEAFYEGYDYADLLERFSALDSKDVAEAEWDALATLGDRPEEASDRNTVWTDFLASLQQDSQVTESVAPMTATASALGLFARQGDAGETTVANLSPSFI